MSSVTSYDLEKIVAWRNELQTKFEELVSGVEEKRQEVNVLDLKLSILHGALDKYDRRGQLWESFGEELKSNFQKAEDEFEELRTRSYKEQRELEFIIKNIEEFLKRHNYNN